MQMLLVALLACLSVAAASPIGGVIAINNAVVNTPAQQSVLIDVTSDFLDIMQNQHIFQVAVGVSVLKGEMYINGQRIARGVQVAVQFSAQFRELEHGTNKLISAKNVQVAVQAVVQAQITNDVMSSLTVQMLLSEVDGNSLTQVQVQEVVVFLNPNGAESHRQTRAMGVQQSQITTTTTSTTSTTSSDGSVTGKADTTDSDSDSDSNSDSPAGAEADGEHKKCRVRQFFTWLHKQSFGVRLLVFAIILLFVFVTLRVLLCLCIMCCCAKPKSRTTYLDNVKLHYVPLSMDDDDSMVKKHQLI